jgi:small subunit ribosomal protein S8
MPVNDPIADFLTRVRNAVRARKKYVDIPSSNMKVELSKILKENKFIKDFSIAEDNKQNILRVYLQYLNGEPSITGMRRVSTPGLRKYSGKDDVPRVLGGLGVSIISTSKGLLTDRQAKQQSVGGEIVCYIW